MKALAIPLVLLLLVPALAQESKPAKTEKPASAPASRPTEMALLGRKVTLTVPGDWTETKTPSTFAPEAWKVAKGWEHPKIKGFAIHVFGAEAKDLTPATLAQKWIDSAGKAKPELLVSVTGKNKSVKGLDLEAELNENGSFSFYWLRAIAASKDRVLVVLAEASPLDREALETIVLAAGSILDTVLDPTGKDPWRRDPEVKVTCGDLVARITVPSGWKYTRLAPEGSPIWMGPGNGQEIILAFPLRMVDGLTDESMRTQAAPMIYKVLVEAEKTIAEQFGKVLAKTDVVGHDQGSEMVTATEIPNIGTQWQRRRMLLDGANVVSVLAKHPIPDISSVPPPAAQKQFAAVMDSLKIEIKPVPK